MNPSAASLRRRRDSASVRGSASSWFQHGPLRGGDHRDQLVDSARTALADCGTELADPSDLCEAAGMPYPTWSYFPRNSKPPLWVPNFVSVVAAAERVVSTEPGSRLSSDEVLAALEPGLRAQGYAVETGKRKDQKISRPVLFGENGVPQVSYEIDAFHDELGVAVEVEAGRGAANNADYRDLVRTSLILDAHYLALATPLVYRAGRQSIRAYDSTRRQLEALYASDRLRLPFRGVLVVGY